MNVEGRQKFKAVLLEDTLYLIGGTQSNIITLNVNNPFTLSNIPYVFWRQLQMSNTVFGCCVPSDTNELLCINQRSYFISQNGVDSEAGYQSTGFNCLLYNDALLVYGGGNQQDILNNLYLYTPRDEQWKQIQHTIPPLQDYTWTVVNNAAYMIGGSSTNGLSNIKNVYKLDLSTLAVQQITTSNGPPSRIGHGACNMGQYIYIYGGASLNGTLNDFWAFDTQLNIWTQIPMALPNRKFHQLICIRRHVFMIFGNDGTSDQYTLFLYAPDRNISSLVNDYKPLGDSINIQPPNFGRNAPVNTSLSIGAILGITLASLLIFIGMVLCIWVRKSKRDKLVFYDEDYDESEEMEEHGPARFQREESYKEPVKNFTVLNPDNSSSFSFK